MPPGSAGMHHQHTVAEYAHMQLACISSSVCHVQRLHCTTLTILVNPRQSAKDSVVLCEGHALCMGPCQHPPECPGWCGACFPVGGAY